MKAVRNLAILISSLILHFHAYAQKPFWQWAGYGVNSGNTIAVKVGVDDAGNVYSASNFAGSLTLGDSSYTAHGSENTVIAKYNHVGKLLWSRRLGDTGKTTCTALTVDQNTGDVYVAGTFQYKLRLSDVAKVSLRII